MPRNGVTKKKEITVKVISFFIQNVTVLLF